LVCKVIGKGFQAAASRSREKCSHIDRKAATPKHLQLLLTYASLQQERLAWDLNLCISAEDSQWKVLIAPMPNPVHQPT